MEQVKFVALDRDDIEVISTHLQDALVKVADVVWRPQEKRLVITLSRFDWPSAEGSRPQLRRCQSALLSIFWRGLRPGRPRCRAEFRRK